MSSSSALDDGEAGGTRVGRGDAPSQAGRAAGAAGLTAGRSRVGNGSTDWALGADALSEDGAAMGRAEGPWAPWPANSVADEAFCT